MSNRMTFIQESKYVVENNGQYTYFGQNGNYARIINNKINTIHKYKVSSLHNDEIYCIFIGHAAGSFKLCSENKKMINDLMKVLPQNDNIKKNDY